MATLTSEKLIKSFLKWPGGKSKILPRLLPLFPTHKRFIEPFVGSGVVFLNNPHCKQFVLNDINADLMSLFHIIKSEKKHFIDYAKSFFVAKNNQKEKYYELRDLFNTSTNERLRAALFIYFNRHGFNGLCRYNSKLYFNVPFGQYKHCLFPEHALLQFSKSIQSATLFDTDFELIMEETIKGDLIYCDPPYVPLSKTALFTGYAGGTIFGETQHIALATMAEKLKKRGVTVIISNHATPWTRKLYKNATKKEFNVRRLISANGERDEVKELIAIFN